MGHGGMNVVQAADGAIGRRTPSADGRRRFRLPSPAAFQFVKRRIELAPLAAGEERPFERVLKQPVVHASLAARVFGAGSPDVHAIENRGVPRAVVGPFADDRVQLPPVVGGDRFVPIVQVAEDRLRHPKATGVANHGQIRNRLGQPGMGFLAGPESPDTVSAARRSDIRPHRGR